MRSTIDDREAQKANIVFAAAALIMRRKWPVARIFRPFEVFRSIAFMYLVITLVFTGAVAWFEARNPIQ